MPRKDGTGPNGKGPKTGRGRGSCAGGPGKAKNAPRAGGKGLGKGARCGGGRGRRSGVKK
ncbi:MAG TPA: hypothetical protein DER10_08650 [Elusimicrobia bacterium]|nr:hypothetical protein [Elusimicrobiota bacterium]HCE98548.1 hypothetical protein [Elusimicrobiota bacterium]